MNLLLVSPTVCLGGAERAVIYLAYYLKQKGHKVYIFTTYLDFANVSEEAKSLDYINPNIRILKRVEGRFEIISNPFLFFQRLFLLRKAIKRTIEEKNIEVIHAHNPPGHWMSVFHHIPLLWSANDPITTFKPYAGGSFSLQSKKRASLLKEIGIHLYKLLDSAIVKTGIDKIIVLDERGQKRIKEYYNRNSQIVRLGINFNFFSKDLPDLHDKYLIRAKNEFNIIQVGQLTYSKNQLCTIRAFRIIKSQIGHAKLILVGDGPLREEIEAEIKKLNLQNSVELTGHTSEENLRILYQKSHICSFPAVKQTYGLTPFEALAANTISIVSSDCGTSEVIQKENIGLISDPTPQDFAEKMLHIYQQPEETINTIIRGRIYVKKNLSYESYCREVENILADLIAHKNSAP
ncbi:MAG: glycosyltransferase family 4 protein [candidate division WOR-3 bacterium]|nr:glycosyltransferase family 4 protein [candidate division WOR-3 bacterium]